MCAATLSTSPRAGEPAHVTAEQVGALLAPTRPHPRLFVPPDREAWAQRVAADPLLSRTRDGLLRRAEAILDLPPVKRELKGRRLLGESRRGLERVVVLAAVHRLSGDRRFLARAEAEMLAAAAFSDWNPGHFLDVAEMTAALAIGYDWLHDGLDAPTRQALRTAIRDLGIAPSLDEKASGNWWLTTHNNWNQVCHTGMALGALAIAEHEPELAARIVARSINGLPRAMGEYAPDGAYPEGPGYWEYGTSYNVLLLAALEGVLGSDFGLGAMPGFMASADYVLHMGAPTGQWFNYADCGAGRHRPASAAMFWLAARRAAPHLLWHDVPALEADATAMLNSGKERERLLPLILVWGLGRASPTVPAALDWCGHGPTPVAVHRSSWTDPSAVFVGIKAGTASANHAHMDAGSFVLDAGGVRWALDLGSQDYHSLESRNIQLWSRGQDAERWRVFRLNNLSHSTLVVDGQFQRVAGFARILEHRAAPESFTVVDLGEVYSGQLAAARRTVCLHPDRSVTIEDRLVATQKPCRVRWGMVTAARVALAAGPTAALNQDGKTLTATAEGTGGAPWEVFPTDPPPADYDAANPGTCLLGFTISLEAGEERSLRVRLALAAPAQ
ncbi:MAG: Heparinase II/III-like protein [Lentisphaerae bacterium ADurb.BinA184]|nr:MAG: Heparinase II/III-like protein [Lentisphaerae bacterium ADurb.BinA184]